MPFFKSPRGLNWHYARQGSGDAIIFIHGWGVNGRIWRQQMKAFSRRHQVVSVDLPGHGESGFAPASLDEMAEDLEWLVSSLGIETLHIVGSSFGGLLALKLTERIPDRVKGVVLTGSQPKFVRSGDYPFGLEPRRVRKLAGQIRTDYPVMVHIFFRSLFSREERASRRFRWIQIFRRTDNIPDQAALLWLLDILEQADLRSVWLSLKHPVQMINGTLDEICPPAGIEAAGRDQPRARLDWLERCGHFPFLSRPEEFNRKMESFLNAVA